MKIAVKNIFPNPEQPRMEFDPDELADLAESIREHGLINPIALELVGENVYWIIDGERRWRACVSIGLTEIEADVRPAMNSGGQQERLILALIANLKRKNINPVEEGYAYKKLLSHGMSLEEISRIAGFHSSNVRIRMRLTEFEPEIQDLFAHGHLPVHAQTVAAIRELPDESRVRISRSLANRKATIPVIVSICRRAANAATGEHKGSKGKKEGANGHFNALSLVGAKVLDQKLTQAVTMTCHNCILFEDACLAVCSNCPVVELVKRLIK